MHRVTRPALFIDVTVNIATEPCLRDHTILLIFFVLSSHPLDEAFCDFASTLLEGPLSIKLQDFDWQMAIKGKSRKKGNAGKTNGKSGAKNGNNGGKVKGAKKSRRSGGKARFAMDIFNEEMMENAYYTCHNIMDVLKCRGFPWPEAQKKKKKKGRK